MSRENNFIVYNQQQREKARTYYEPYKPVLEELINKGLSQNKIVAWLNKEGYRTNTGNIFYRPTLKTMFILLNMKTEGMKRYKKENH